MVVELDIKSVMEAVFCTVRLSPVVLPLLAATQVKAVPGVLLMRGIFKRVPLQLLWVSEVLSLRLLLTVTNIFCVAPMQPDTVPVGVTVY